MRRFTYPQLASGALGVAILLLVIALWRPSRLQPARQDEIVSSPALDTVPMVADTLAIGLCALNRWNGAFEGRVVGVEMAPAGGAGRYEIEAADDSGYRFFMRPEALTLDLCERALGVDHRSPPLRVAPR